MLIFKTLIGQVRKFSNMLIFKTLIGQVEENTTKSFSAIYQGDQTTFINVINNIIKPGISRSNPIQNSLKFCHQ